MRKVRYLFPFDAENPAGRTYLRAHDLTCPLIRVVAEAVDGMKGFCSSGFAALKKFCTNYCPPNQEYYVGLLGRILKMMRRFQNRRKSVYKLKLSTKIEQKTRCSFKCMRTKCAIFDEIARSTIIYLCSGFLQSV
jgi:hypothetical protein